MRLLNVSRRDGFLVLDTDLGTRKRSLDHPDMQAMEALCKKLIGEEVIVDSLPGWDPQVWFWSLQQAQ